MIAIRSTFCQAGGGDGDVVEQAKAHGAVARGVMSRRAHQGDAIVERARGHL